MLPDGDSSCGENDADFDKNISHAGSSSEESADEEMEEPRTEKISRKKNYSKCKRIICNSRNQVRFLLFKLAEFKKSGYKVKLINCENESFESLSQAIFLGEKKCQSGEIKYFLFMVRWVDHDSSKISSIGLNTLHTDDFHYKKLYKIYLKNREKLQNEKKVLTNFIVFCNLDSNPVSFKNASIVVVNSTNNREKSRLEVPQEAKIFNGLLSKKASKLREIAEKLAFCKVRCEGVLARYHSALIHEKVWMIIGEKKNKKIAKFCDEFIHDRGLSKNAQKVRSYLRRMSDLESMGNVEFTLSSKFKTLEKVTSHLPDEPEERQDIRDFYAKLRFYNVKNNYVDKSLSINELNSLNCLVENPLPILETLLSEQGVE